MLCAGCLSNTSIDAYLRTCGSSYTYNPDYHGPLPLFLGAAAFLFFGVNDYALRLPSAVYSVLTIVSIFFLRKEISDSGTLIAAAVLAFSPSMVYYSGFSPSDNLQALLTVTLIAMAAAYHRDRKNTWLYMMSINLALMLATKETTFIFAFSAASFLALDYTFRILKNRGHITWHPHISPSTAKTCAISILIFAAVYC